MDDLVRQGKVLYWGTSVWEPEQLDEATAIADRRGAYAPRVEQPRYNLLDRHVEAAILPTCARHGMGVVVWSPLGEGLLTGKYAGGIPKDSRAASDERMRDALKPEDVERARRLGRVADELGVPLPQMALAWCLRRPEVTSAITGASRPAHVAQNAAAAELVLDDATLAAIDAALVA
jgi:aryl-alcohol dehydrogenase-like predicted oxidoreductase